MPKGIIRSTLMIFILLILVISGSSRLVQSQASNLPEEPLTLLPLGSSDKTQVVRIFYSTQV